MGTSIQLARAIIVPSSRDLVLKWAEVMVAARKRGRPLETADAWIAATAMLYQAPLITHNAGDYLGVPGVRSIRLSQRIGRLRVDSHEEILPRTGEQPVYNARMSRR